jgi:MFS family permease
MGADLTAEASPKTPTEYFAPVAGDAAPAAADGVRRRPGVYAHYVLAMLCLASMLSTADRGVVSLLLQPIKKDLHASDTLMSLLTGASFVIFYAFFGIPLARWADRGNRRSILALGIAVWSLMTAACGLAGNFAVMTLARAGVGIGEAAGTPTSASLIADYFHKTVRPQAFALFYLAVPLGSILVMPLVGRVADAWGWRAAFFALGVPGVLVALIVRLTVREPARGATDASPPAAAQPGNALAVFRTMYASRPFRLIQLGMAVTGLGTGVLVAWGPAMMMRAFHVTTTQVASIALPLGALGGIAGTLGGGYFTSWLVKRRRSERWLVLAPALVSLLTIPAAMLYVWPPSWAWMIFALMIGSSTGTFSTSPYLALCLELVPANCRGMAAATRVIATSVIGSAGGPLVVGIVSDILTPKFGQTEGLRYAFMFAPLTLILGVMPFFMALRNFDANGLKAKSVD